MISRENMMIYQLRSAQSAFCSGDTVGFEWDVRPVRGIVTGIHKHLSESGVEFWYNIGKLKGVSYQEHYIQTRRIVLTEKFNGF